jgi:hypothetical protein
MATEDLQINIGANTQDLQTGLNNATNSIKAFGTAVQTSAKPTGDATNALTNLSRVAQDAPYGFMGIANNLNPLLESFQRLSKESGGAGAALKTMVGGLMGPAGLGLALGVVSSLVVTFGDDIQSYVQSLLDADGATKEMKSALASIGNEFTGAVEKVDKVKIAFEEYHKGVLTGDQALKIYNDTLGANLGVKSNINEAERVYKEKTAAYVEASFQRALADAASKKAAEELLKQKVAQAEGPKLGFSDYAAGFGMGNFDLSGGTYRKAAQANLDNTVQSTKDAIKIYQKIAEDAKTASDTIAKSFSINLDPEKTKRPKSAAKASLDIDTSELDLLKKKQQLYKDDIDAFKDYADKIVLEEERIAILKAQHNKASATEIANIHEIAQTSLLQNQKNLGIAIMKIADENTKEREKQEKDAAKKDLDEKKKAAKDAIDVIQDQMDIEEKMAGKDFDKKRDAVKKAMVEMKSLMTKSNNPEIVDDLTKSYDKLGKRLKMLDIEEQEEKTKKLNESYTDFAKTVSKGVSDGLMTMFDAMQKGESPLKALTDMITKMVAELAAAVVQALIFKAIMSAFGLGGLAGGEEGGGGGLLGGIGKIFGFAEGGIVSRPTIAMVGEGGQSEAIMPLNKLGNMMNSTFNSGAMSGAGGGSGNGQFVLKGSDLILAMNRSNFSLNVRR